MKSEFPATVKRGSATLKIYLSHCQGGYRIYTVAYYEGGKRRRASFGDPDEARAEAVRVATRLTELITR
jgi:soluble lytic murein transglycosylase-like protein